MLRRKTNPIEQYLRRVLSAEDKILFSEAVANASVSALRSAYIMIWITVAESLKRKFRELASRDNSASRVVGEITRKEAAHLAIDVFLLNESKNYGFVNESEYVRLQHIYSLRCIFGHPYEQQPGLEALAAAAADVVEIVLSRPTLLRQGYLSEQVRLLTEDVTYLDNIRDVVERYAVDVFEKTDPTLHLWFLQKLWSKMAEMASDPAVSGLFYRGVWFSSSYLRTGKTSLFSTWNVTTDLTRFPTVLSLVLSDPDLFSILDAHPKDITFSNLLTTAGTSASHLKQLEILHDAGVLSSRQLIRFKEEIDSMKISFLSATEINPKFYVEKIISALKSHNWYTQNPAVDVLMNLGPDKMCGLQDDQLRCLGNNILQSAEGGASHARSFLDDLNQNLRRWPTKFIEGIISECFFNEKNEIRFKLKCADRAMKTIKNVAPNDRTSIAIAITQRIQSGKIDPDRGQAIDEATELVGGAITYDPELDVLAPVLDALKGLSVPNIDPNPT